MMAKREGGSGRWIGRRSRPTQPAATQDHGRDVKGDPTMSAVSSRPFCCTVGDPFRLNTPRQARRSDRVRESYAKAGDNLPLRGGRESCFTALQELRERKQRVTSARWSRIACVRSLRAFAGHGRRGKTGAPAGQAKGVARRRGLENLPDLVAHRGLLVVCSSAPRCRPTAPSIPTGVGLVWGDNVPGQQPTLGWTRARSASHPSRKSRGGTVRRACTGRKK